MEGYGGAYPEDAMLFMDFRRHHTGLYDGTASRQQPGASQHGGDGLWGTEGEVPSFLYAMPLGGGRVFLEETCLVARPALPFATLKRRLERRCKALGITVRRRRRRREGLVFQSCRAAQRAAACGMPHLHAAPLAAGEGSA